MHESDTFSLFWLVEKSKSDSEGRLIKKLYLITIPNFFFRAFQPRQTNLKFQFFLYKIHAVQQQSLKVLEGLDQRYIFSEKTRFLFWVTHEKFQKPENFCFFVRISLKRPENGWKKVHGKSLSVRIRKNSGTFISNGPILLVWVTHKKFELEGLIWKLFTVKPRAIVHTWWHMICDIYVLFGKVSVHNFNVSLFPNCGEKVLKRITSSCTQNIRVWHIFLRIK